MKNYSKRHVLVAMVAALVVAASIAEVSHALPGPAPTNTAIAEYFPGTGVIIVSFDQVRNWYVESKTDSMTGLLGAPPALPHNGGLVSDNVTRIGEWVPGGNFSFTDLDLGVVTSAGLAPGDLSIWYNAAGFGSDREGPFTVIGNESTGGLLADFDVDGDVDGADFLVWQRGFGGTYNATDLANWETEFGTTGSTANISAIPEPASIVLLAMIGLAGLARRRR